MEKMDKLADTLNRAIVNGMAKWEAESWKETTNVTFKVLKTVRAKSGRECVLKGEWSEQSERCPRGITKEDALAMGTVVRMVTTTERRIK